MTNNSINSSSNSSEVASATSVDDILYGNSFDNTLEGGIGNDSLYGGGGSDNILGGAGDDFLSGSSNISNYWSNFWIDPYPSIPIDPYENWGSESWEVSWYDDLYENNLFESYLDFGEVDSSSANVFSPVTDTNAWIDSFYYYGTSSDIFSDPYSSFISSWYGYSVADEVDTLTGGEGADTFALGSDLGSYYQDDYYYQNDYFDPYSFGSFGFLAQTNDYAIITDFDSQEGDVFQVYGNIEHYTLSTGDYTGSELSDTLISYGSDLIAVVSDNTEISLEQDFVAVGTTPDFSQYLGNFGYF